MNDITIRSMQELDEAFQFIRYPVAVRPSFTFRNHGSGLAHDQLALIGLVTAGLDASPTGEVQLVGLNCDPVAAVVDRLDYGVSGIMPAEKVVRLADHQRLVTRLVEERNNWHGAFENMSNITNGLIDQYVKFAIDWKYDAEHKVWHLKRGEVLIELQHRPSHCDRGHWMAIVDGIPSIDDADGFPRYYMDEARAKLELQDWLDWRLSKEKKGPQ